MIEQETHRDESRNPSLIEVVRAALAALGSGLQTRLALAATELEEERERLKQTLALTFLIYFSLSFGFILLTIFVVVLFWENGFIYALGSLAALYLAVAAVAGHKLRRKLRHRPGILSATLAELEKDRRRFKAAPHE